MVQLVDELFEADEFALSRRSDSNSVNGKMRGDGILDDFEQCFVGVDGADLEFTEQLDHQTAESFECSGYFASGVD